MKQIWYSLILLVPLLFVGCADAGKDQVVTSATTVTLDGSASTTEVDGEITKYKWRQVSGKKVKLQNKNSVKSTFTAPTVLEDTVLTFRLITVEKGGYLSPLKSDDTVDILVKPQTSSNTPPTANIQTSATTIKLNQSINFDASASTDTEGEIVSYKWTNTAGDIISSDKIFDYTFTSVGNHTITLTVTDEQGLSSSDFVEIVVNDLINPIAKIIVDSDKIYIGGSVNFDASTSSDADGQIVSYLWKDSQDNILSSEKAFAQTFDNLGQYPITLTVEDNDGLTHTEEIIITVQAVLTSIDLSPESISLKIDETATISATGNYNDGTSLDITSNAPWTISDNTIISIDNTGTITALKSGTVTIQTIIEGIESNIVTINVDEPIVLKSITISPNPITLRVNSDKTLDIKGIYSDGTTKDIEENIFYEIADTTIASFDGTNTITGLAQGDTTLKITAGNISSPTINISVTKELVTTNFDFTHFGTKYIDQIPANSTKEKYDEKLFSMLAGKILDEDGNPIPNVKVSILNHSEYGSVQTDSNGSYSLPAEGAKYLVVRYEKEGYTTVDRKVYAYAEDWAVADDVTMLTIDEKVTTIDLNSSTPQVHSSTVVTDDRGSRATTLVFSGVGSATVKSPDGSIRTLDSIDVRATEFKTPESMPSDLPIETAYTYCTDITVDGVKDNETVEFNSSIIMYVNNFLGFEVGEIVPVGYYDRNQGKWIGSKNGVVVELLDTDGDGKVDSLDATGDGVADDIDGDGSTTSEVKGIEDNPAFQAGMTLWRSEITHFTPYDCNWPYAPDPDVRQPDNPQIDNEDENNNDDEDENQNPEECVNSYVETKKRVFHEDIKIPGTDLTLHYSSKRVDGYKHRIKIDGLTKPHFTATKAVVKTYIAGQEIEKELDLSNFKDSITLEWDGKDRFGNKMFGKSSARVEYQIDYKAYYQKSREEFAQAWSQTGVSRAIEIPSRNEVGLRSVKRKEINNEAPPKYNSVIANGWSLSNHNIATIDLIQKGDGTTIKNDSFSARGLEEIENTIQVDGRYNGWAPNDISFGSSGNLYFSGEDNNVSKIIKIDPSSNIEVISGGGSGSIADGSSASDLNLGYINSITTDNDGNIYFPYNYNQIKKINSEGIVSTVAGTGEDGFFGDFGLAMHAKLSGVDDIEIDKYGNLYFIDGSRVRRVDTNGVITTIAGNENEESSGDGGLAINASLLYPTDLTFDSAGNIYILESWKTRIRKIDYLTGMITTIAGTGESGYSGDEGLAIEAKISGSSIDVSDDNKLYITDRSNYKVRMVNLETGYISTVLDKNLGIPSVVTNGLKDTFYIGSYDSILKSSIKPLFGISLGEDEKIYLNGNNTAEIYSYSLGRHLRTIDLLTKKTLKEFEYDSKNRLIGILDQFGNHTIISRDSNGNPTQITAPNGQVTKLTVDTNGDLVSVSYEDNSGYTLEYLNGSLLTRVTHPNNSQSVNIFDEDGRIEKEIDSNNEEWIFDKSITDTYVQYMLKKPEGDLYYYRDYELDNNKYITENTLPSGDKITIVSSESGKSVKTTTNNTSIDNTFIDDERTNRRKLSDSITIQPSGLKKINSTDTSYITNNDNVLLSKTETITLNGKSTIIKNDYENAIDIVTTPEGRVYKDEYNINTRLTSKTTSGTLTPTTYAYDNKGRVTSQTTGTRTISYTYSPRGNISTITSARNKTTFYEYDILDRLTKVTHPNGAVENYTYDNSGNMTKIVTPITTEHNFTYDNLDKRKSMQSPLNKLTSYTYNGNRKLIRIDRPSGKSIVNTYVNDRLAKTVTDESNSSYDYLFDNKISRIIKGNELIIYSYDGDLLTSLTYGGELNQILTYTYNNDFLTESFTYAGSTENYTYDNDNLMLTSGNYTLTRDINNAYVTKITDGSLVQNYTYDSYGELTKVSDNSFTYEITDKDNSSLITQKTETINGATVTYDYTYDDNARLTEVKKDNTIVESYRYDNNGNRSSAIVNGVTTSASYTLDDQLEVYGNNTYRYDDDGYLQEKTTPDGVTTYKYSTLGELKEVKTPTQTITYKHNANNQRIAKLIDGIVVEKYLWANLTTLLAVYDGKNNLLQRFEYADNRLPISMTSGENEKYYLHYDQVGSLRLITDINNNIIKELTYDSFGNILLDNNERVYIPFGFAGGLLDKDTGLTRFGFRDYDSYTGKWTAKDPIDFSGGDSNLYGYVVNNPINFIDPEGKAPGAGGGVHIGPIGINHHVDINGNKTTCIRVGPGIFFGAGGEYTHGFEWDNGDSNGCEIGDSETWTLGLGFDLGLWGIYKGGASAGAGPDGGSVTVSPVGVGLGISVGVEYCYSR